MTVLVWMASPPEVHSALLSAGPGAGSLTATAAAWTSLSTEYAAVADELSTLVGAVQSGAWEGLSADAYGSANAPYLAWLLQASANSATMATQQETAAAAYAAALAAMPTLAELSANHAAHAALVATNFFGINTIPIALNEADYARMWVQAAATMSLYDAVSTAAVAAAPTDPPPPQITKVDADNPGAPNHAPPPPPQHGGQVPDDFLAQLFKDLIPGDIYKDNGANSFWELIFPQGDFNPGPLPPGSTPLTVIERMFNDAVVGSTYLPDYLTAAHNPAQQIAVAVLLGIQLFTHRIPELLQLAELLGPQLAPALASVAPAPAVGGFAGLAGLAGMAPPAVAPAAAPPIPVGAEHQPAIAVAPVLSSAPAAVPASAPAPAAAATAPPPAPPPVPPPPITGTEALAFPYLVGGPGIGSAAGMVAAAKTREPTSRSAAAAPATTAASARENRPARRRRRTQMQGHGHGYMEMNVEVEPEWDTPSAASDRGAGALGFAGVADHPDAAATGLATLAGDSFGGGSTVPMMPSRWQLPGDQSPD